MVGYGAGAWMMSKLLRLGQDVPPIHTGLDHCPNNELPDEDSTSDENTSPDATDPASPEDEDESEFGDENTETDNTEEIYPEAVASDTSETDHSTEKGGCHAAPGPLYLLPLIVGLLRRRK